MRVYDYKAYRWNGGMCSGNVAGVDIHVFIKKLDELGLPWYSDGTPYSSGISYVATPEQKQYILESIKC